MIEKFISIKNIGRFRDCRPRGDVTFRKMTLLFAESGRGKATLYAKQRPSIQALKPIENSGFDTDVGRPKGGGL